MKRQLNQGKKRKLQEGVQLSRVVAASAEKGATTFADRLRQLIGTESVNGFATRCGIREGSIRQYLEGAMPRTDKLAKIAVANHVSVDWLATDRGPMRYDQARQLRSDDATRAAYLDDPAAGARIGAYISDTVPRLLKAQAALESISASIGFGVPTEWHMLLLGLLADEHITELGARRVLEHLKGGS